MEIIEKCILKETVTNEQRKWIGQKVCKNQWRWIETHRKEKGCNMYWSLLIGKQIADGFTLDGYTLIMMAECMLATYVRGFF